MNIRRADFTDPADGAAIVALIDAYACDPRGGGAPLPPDARERLVPGLAAHPMACAWLAFQNSEPVGVCIGFIGYSTFNARPLLNIHDLAVLPGCRGQGMGRALLGAAQDMAIEAGCCKLTLEVQRDNQPARRLYDRFGFTDLRFGDSGPTDFLVKPLPGAAP